MGPHLWARCHVTPSPAHMANLSLTAEPERDRHGQPEYVDITLIDGGQCRQVTVSPFCLPRWTVESCMSVDSSEGPSGSSICGILHVVSLYWLHQPPHPHSLHYVLSKLSGHLDHSLGLCIPKETRMRPSPHLSPPDSGPWFILGPCPKVNIWQGSMPQASSFESPSVTRFFLGLINVLMRWLVYLTDGCRPL